MTAHKVNPNKNFLGKFFLNNSLCNLLLRTYHVQDIHEEILGIQLDEEA